MRDVYPSYPSLPPEWLVPPDRQPEYLPIPGLTLAERIDLGEALSDAHVAAGRGDLTALIHHETGERLTYRQLADGSRRAAAALRGLGVRPGDRVALRGPNRPWLVVAALGAWKLGAIVVPTPVQARAAELRYFVADTQPAVLLCAADPSVVAEIPEAVANGAVPHVLTAGGAAGGYRSWDELLTDPQVATRLPAVPLDSVAIVWHTGGTTGHPKGCYHTQRRFLLGGHALGRAVGTAPGQVWAAAAPIGHALGFIYHTIYTLLHGATIVLIEGFGRPEVVLRAIEEHRVDTFTAIAATWARLLESMQAGTRADLSSIRRAYAMWQSASSTAVSDAWAARGIHLLNNFGSTAFATWVLVPPLGAVLPAASLGRTAPGYRIVATEPDVSGVEALPANTPGRMAVRGPTGLTYWRRAELQRRDVVDGWTLVDDLIRIDGTGATEYLGRTDFLISTAGYKVAPVEVERVLAGHAAVREVAVLGIPDPVRQEVVAAFVALHPGYEPGDALRKELQDLVKSQLSPYKYPRRVEFVEALPRDDVGKVQPRRLKEGIPA